MLNQQQAWKLEQVGKKWVDELKILLPRQGTLTLRFLQIQAYK
jgi:hypothetical protein